MSASIDILCHSSRDGNAVWATDRQVSKHIGSAAEG